MRFSEGNLEISPTDLSGFLACHHKTALDMAVARGLREAPKWNDPAVAILQKRGQDHERRYSAELASHGLNIVNLEDYHGEEAVRRTLEAMKAGADAILQGALSQGEWFGRPDVLRKIFEASAFGNWSYEVEDTKLAKETRGGTILQLATYTDLLASVQKKLPERFHVVTPDRDDPIRSYRVQEYAAYFRLIRGHLGRAILDDPAALAAANYPIPVEHCDVCRWRIECDRRRHADDHLSLVAGISRLQTRELEANGINTLTKLGSLERLPFTPSRGAVETYEKIREQARVQLEGRNRKKPYHELLQVEIGQGLTRLPMPSKGDIFLDLEGDPFGGDAGREYLFGLVSIVDDGTTTYRRFWATDEKEEREAFDAAMEVVLDSWAADPGMHVYHYAPYEPSAFKRLMGRHAIREEDVDRMLRAGIFVDLYSIVRHSLRASVERYSIKDLEPFYSFERSISLEDAGTHRRLVEAALELGYPKDISSKNRAAVEAYNGDDCRSALHLRNWLEDLRSSLEGSGTSVPRPAITTGQAPQAVDERGRRAEALRTKLTADLPAVHSERTREQQARWLLGNMLDWHRREAKCQWWEFFRLRELSDDELLGERQGLSGLRFVERVGGTKRSPIDRYSFPPQDSDIREGADLRLLGEGASFGGVDAIDYAKGTVDIKKRGAQAENHPSAVFAYLVVDSGVLEDALFRIAEEIADHGITEGSRYRAARDLLLKRTPRLHQGTFQPKAQENAVQFSVRIVSELDETVLAIQGPPGSGKTYTGARMICEAVRRGLRVGVTAVSHKVIRNLLEATLRAAKELNLTVVCGHKVSDRTEDPGAIEEIKDNDALLGKIADREIQVAGGTAWFWARAEAHEAVDVLFVDEAGQMSLANVLAVSTGAKSTVLLGDPQQLEQPQQGSHPEGTDVSALEYVLDGHKTIASDRGIFMPETWRLAPQVCQFTSEVFYEGRLQSRGGLEEQKLQGTAPFVGAGLWLVPVTHQGNQNCSPEEVDAAVKVVSLLLRDGAQWIDDKAVPHPLCPADILVVAPYNAQVALLGEKLQSRDVRVGTVDKFQGQQAPIVVYSMATSTPEDAPRGMEFLYSLNRLNVATSRARCACILIVSPRLLEPECKSPRQMQLANALCRYAEMANTVSVG